MKHVKQKILAVLTGKEDEIYQLKDRIDKLEQTVHCLMKEEEK